MAYRCVAKGRRRPRTVEPTPITAPIGTGGVTTTQLGETTRHIDILDQPLPNAETHGPIPDHPDTHDLHPAVAPPGDIRGEPEGRTAVRPKDVKRTSPPLSTAAGCRGLYVL